MFRFFFYSRSSFDKMSLFVMFLFQLLCFWNWFIWLKRNLGKQECKFSSLWVYLCVLCWTLSNSPFSSRISYCITIGLYGHICSCRMASWCRKCIYLKPKLEKLAADYYRRFALFSFLIVYGLYRGIAHWTCWKLYSYWECSLFLYSLMLHRLRFYRVDVNNVPHKLVTRAGVTVSLMVPYTFCNSSFFVTLYPTARRSKIWL